MTYKLNSIIIILLIVSSLGLIAPTANASSLEDCSDVDISSDRVIVQDKDIYREYVDSSGSGEPETKDCIVEENVNEFNVLKRAVEEANYGETVIIRQKTGSTSYKQPYYGLEISEDEFSSEQNVKIKGEEDGFVAVQSENGGNYAFNIQNNNHEEVVLENIHIIGDPRGVYIGSKSNVELKDVSIDSTDVNNPIEIEKSIAAGSSGKNGMRLDLDGVYYAGRSAGNQPDIADIAKVQGGSINIVDNGKSDLNSLSVNRKKQPLTNNPVLEGSISNVIRVRGGSSSVSNEDITNDFKTLQAAIDAADSNAVIELRPHQSSGYNDIKVTGSSVSSAYDITIKPASGVDTANVSSFEFRFPGSYDLKNLNIRGDIDVQSNNVNVDATENYWKSAGGPNQETDINIDEGVTSSVSTQPFCTDLDCNNIKGYKNYPYCLKIQGKSMTSSSNTSINCPNSEELIINIGEFENQYNPSDNIITDKREIDFDIQANGNTRFDIKGNILESDQSSNLDITVGATQSSRSVESDPTFGVISNQMNTPRLSINPRIEFTINENDPILINLDDSSLEIRNPDRSIYTNDQSVVESPPDKRYTDTYIEETEYDGVIPEQERFVTRFNAESSSSPYQTNSIPPYSRSGGQVTSASVGELKEFSNARRDDNDRQAIITPDQSRKKLYTGFSFDNVPSAEQHTIQIEYAYQAADKLRNNIKLTVTDENGNEITNDDMTTEFESTDDSGDVFDTIGKAGGKNIGVDTINRVLSEKEVNYINTNGEIYFQINNSNFETGAETLHIYNAKIVSTDNFDIEDESPVNVDDSEQQVYPGDLSVSFSMNAKLSKYNTYDYEPGEEALIDIKIENTGDTSIKQSFSVQDEYSGPSQGIPGDTSADDLISGSYEEEIISISDQTIPPGDTVTISETVSWSEAEFGTHDIKLYKELDDGSLEKLDKNNDRTPSAKAYVKQPATVSIDKINVPDEHVPYDSFRAEIKVENIGDLEGEREITSEFGKWKFSENVSFQSSDARDENDTSRQTIIYERDNFAEGSYDLHNFTRREYTTALDVVDDNHTKNGPFETNPIEYSDSPEKSDDYYRANAPFATETGDKTFTVTLNDAGIKGSNPVVGDINNTLQYTNTTDINIYNLTIDRFEVNLNKSGSSVTLGQRPRAENAHVYASAWPYAYPSYNNGQDLKSGIKNTVKGGEAILYGAKNESVDPKNRASIPLNDENVPRTAKPDNRYFSQYYTHTNRVCNPDQLSDLDNRVHTAQSSVDPSDVVNSFLAFSADTDASDTCTNTSRISRMHSMRFVNTTDYDGDITIDTTDDNSISDPTSVINQPNNNTIMSGVNPELYKNIEKDDKIMYGYVTLSNEGSANPVTARIEIITNRSLGSGTRRINYHRAGTIASDNRVIGLNKPSSSSTVGKIDGGYSKEGGEVQFGSDMYDDNVVGAAAVRVKESETVKVPVPIVIRNNENVEGVHKLSVRSRQFADVLGSESNKDYIQKTDEATPQSEIGKSPITTKLHDQWTVPIKVETYGDMILTQLNPTKSQSASPEAPTSTDADDADLRVNEVCRSNSEVVDSSDTSDNRISVRNSEAPEGTYSPDVYEGINPRSGKQSTSEGFERSDGDCLRSGELSINEYNASFYLMHSNLGGENVSINPQLLGEFQAEEHYTRAHRLNSHTSGDRYFAPYNESSKFTPSSNTTSTTQVKTYYNQTRNYISGKENVPNDEFKSTPPTGINSRTNISRNFQEPGFYKIRGAPCRDVGDEDNPDISGPMHYDYTGFTGIPDRNSYTKGDYIVSKTNIDRQAENSTNLYTTHEIENSVYHGTRGCAEHVTSVFVYDITEPVADFRVAHSQTTAKEDSSVDDQDDSASWKTEDVESGTNSADVDVHEGGVLYFDGSTPSNSECDVCYDRPHFTEDNMDIPDWRDILKKGNAANVLHSYRMSSDNVRIAGKGTGLGYTGEYGDSFKDANEISKKGMDWDIDGKDPNFAQDSYCEKVGQSNPDENCYMERYKGDGSVTKPDYYEVVPHRFDKTGTKEVELTVWDDPSLTRGEANSNTTKIDVNVVEDTTDPSVDSVDTYQYNDIGYDKEDGGRSDTLTKWERNYKVFKDASYITGAPTNFDSDYNNTYEGVKTCMEASSSDNSEIGISQDAWYETGVGINGDGINAGNVLVIDDGSYVDSGYYHDEVDRSQTRDGDEKCIIHEDTTENTYNYTVWDHAYNRDSEETDIQYDEDTTSPSIDTVDPDYDTNTGGSGTGSGEDNGWVWAWNDDVGISGGYNGPNVDYEGDDVQFEIEASDSGVGVACIDVQLTASSVSGGTNNDANINDNCQSMGDGGGSDNIDNQGTHGNSWSGDDSNNGAKTIVGSSSTPGEYSSSNYFSASELGSSYELSSNNPSSDSQSTVSEEKVYVIDWHGNTEDKTIDIEVKEDGTSPILEGSYSGCDTDNSDTNDCGKNDIDYRSSGPGSGDGGTPVIDAKVTSHSSDNTTCNEDSDSASGTDCDFTYNGVDVTDMDEKEFDGTIEIDVDASADPDPVAKDAPDADCDCGDDITNKRKTTVTATQEGSFDVKIMDAHGNTETKEYAWKVQATDSDTDKDSCDRSDEDCSSSSSSSN